MKLHIKKLKNNNNVFNSAEKLIFLFIVLSVLMGIGIKSYSAFHQIVEQIGTVLGACIFIIALNTYNMMPDASYNFMGVCYGFIVLFEFLHSLFLESFNVSLQLMLCSSLFQCLTLVCIFPGVKKKLDFKVLFYLYSGLSAFLLALIFGFKLFPQCYSKDSNYTPFYYIAVLCLIVFFTAGLLVLYKRDRIEHTEIKNTVIQYIALTMIYHLITLTYRGTSNLPLIIAHIAKFLSYYPMYVLITKLTFQNPMRLIFTSLNRKNEQLVKKEKLLEKQNLELIWKNKALVKANSLILASEQKYKKLIEFLPDAIILLKGTRVIFTNKGFTNMFEGILPESIIGKDVLEVMPDKFKSELKKDLDYVYEGNNIRTMGEKIHITENKIIDLEYSVLYNIIDSEKHALMILNDVTERKQLQEILNKAQLEEENEKMKIEFLANVSHELRTPINLIYSALQLENMYLVEGSIDNVKKYNKIIKQNCFRLLRIINNLIDATKIDASFFKASMRPMNIVNLIEETSLSVVPYVESKNMKITFDTDVEEKYVSCDPDLIERIILNLLSNAVKYGVYEGSISVLIKDLGENISISIEDNGIGIPADKKESLFQRFTQVDKSFTRNAEGSGIGLYLVKHFVDMHGGTITLNSAEGIGSEFRITLPCCLGLEESAATSEDLGKDLSKSSNIIEKVDIEFADIYMN